MKNITDKSRQFLRDINAVIVKIEDAGMYDLVELKNSAPLVDERGNYIEPCGCIEARVLDDGHYCDTVLNGTGAE